MNDRKLGVDVDGVTDSDGNKHIEYYLPDVLSTTDYYAFGAEMPGRQGVPAMGRYRFGFNGMERDGETPVDGNSYTTDFRQYDPRLGRWLSVDPIVHEWESPYVGFANNPIYFADPSGLSPNGGEVNAMGGTWKSDSKKGYVLQEEIEIEAERSPLPEDEVRKIDQLRTALVTLINELKDIIQYKEEAEQEYRTQAGGWFKALGSKYPERIT